MAHGKKVLGYTLRDKVTGFVGVATGHVTYLTGCSQYLLVPGMGSDGKLREPSWFDEQRCEVLPDVEPVVVDNGQTPGCDAPAPVR